MGVGGPMRAAGGYEGGMGMAQMGGQMAPMGGMAPMGQMGGMGMGMGCVSCQQNYVLQAWFRVCLPQGVGCLCLSGNAATAFLLFCPPGV